jgi:hypothetical protein
MAMMKGAFNELLPGIASGDGRKGRLIPFILQLYPNPYGVIGLSTNILIHISMQISAKMEYAAST